MADDDDRYGGYRRLIQNYRTSHGNDVMKLNVSGTIMQILRKNLMYGLLSHDCDIFNEDNPARDLNGLIFYDYEPEVFECILMSLRNGSGSPPHLPNSSHLYTLYFRTLEHLNLTHYLFPTYAYKLNQEEMQLIEKVSLPGYYYSNTISTEEDNSDSDSSTNYTCTKIESTSMDSLYILQVHQDRKIKRQYVSYTLKLFGDFNHNNERSNSLRIGWIDINTEIKDIHDYGMFKVGKALNSICWDFQNCSVEYCHKLDSNQVITRSKDCPRGVTNIIKSKLLKENTKIQCTFDPPMIRVTPDRRTNPNPLYQTAHDPFFHYTEGVPGDSSQMKIPVPCFSFTGKIQIETVEFEDNKV